MDNFQVFLISLLSSVIGGVIVSILWEANATRVRNCRALPFKGKYEMVNLQTEVPYGGTVTIEYDSGKNRLSPAPVLTVFGEHATGAEDWRGSVEVLGLSNVASGFYTYPNREGGSLRLLLSSDSNHQWIREQGIPSDPKDKPFVRLLKRMKTHKADEPGHLGRRGS